MTDQRAYIFHSEHAPFMPRRHRLHAVVRGEPGEADHGWGTGPAWSAGPGRRDPRGVWILPPTVWTANWEGYTPAFRLAADGRIVLERFEYDDRGWSTRRVDEWLQGEFYCVFKPSFTSDRLYVPFVGGLVVVDRARWIVEVSDGSESIFVRGFTDDDL
jgi:hypothetical protein